jgi:hypothetical protein
VADADARKLPRRLRFAAWIVLCVAVLAGMPIWFVWLRTGNRILHDLPLLAVGWMLGGGCLIGIWVLLKTTPRDAIRLSTTGGLAAVVGGAAWLQVAAVLLLPPVLSDDALRYRADAKLWLLGESPYANPPEKLRELARQDDELTLDVLDVATAYENVETIYLPTSQLAFVAATAFEIALWPLPPPAEVGADPHWREVVPTLPWWERLLPLRLMFGGAAVVATLVIGLILKDAGRSVWYAVLFGWNPLVVVECGGMGHQDIIGGLLLVLAIRRMQRGRASRTGLLLGLAALVKPQVLLLLPNVMRRIAGRGGRWSAVRVVTALTVVIALLASSMMLWDGGLSGWWSTASVYATTWEANGIWYRAIVDSLGGSDGQVAAKLGGLGLLLLATIMLVALNASATAAGYTLLLLYLLVSPVAYPWYLIWPLVLMPLVATQPRLGGLTALVWSATAGLSYQLWQEPIWRLPWPWLAAEYVPVLLAAVAEMLLLKRQRRDGQLGRQPVP